MGNKKFRTADDGTRPAGGTKPQCDYDPFQYSLHKMKGGTIQNYADKQPRALSDEQISKHLSGEHFHIRPEFDVLKPCKSC